MEPHRIFASLANGTLLVFQRQASAPSQSHRLLQRLESQEELDKVLNMERNEWSEQTVCFFLTLKVLFLGRTFHVIPAAHCFLQS